MRYMRADHQKSAIAMHEHLSTFQAFISMRPLGIINESFLLYHAHLFRAQNSHLAHDFVVHFLFFWTIAT